MKKIVSILFCLLAYIGAIDANAQTDVKAPPPKPQDSKPADIRVSQSVRKELGEFYEKIKSINEECRLKRETLKIALSEEAKQILEDRKEEREMDNDVAHK